MKFSTIKFKFLAEIQQFIRAKYNGSRLEDIKGEIEVMIAEKKIIISQIKKNILT